MTIVLPCQQAHPACLVAMPALRASIHADPGSVACSFLSNPLAADMRFVARAVGRHALAVALRRRRHRVIATSGRFGTECQRDYQNGWRTTLDHSWERCDWFNDELNDTDTQVYYYDLHGAKPWWENTDELDQVNLVYANTHGGGWSDKSVWSMWDSFTRAYSTSMRLGDQSYGTSIFSTYACEALKFNDGKQWTRMGSIFRGGLRIATGSHDKVYDSVTTNEVGEDYADNLQKQHTIKYAWKDGNSDWYVDQDITVMATGTNQSSCQSRRDNMKWQNFTSYPRLRDGQIGWYCYWYWDNL